MVVTKRNAMDAASVCTLVFAESQRPTDENFMKWLVDLNKEAATKRAERAGGDAGNSQSRKR